MITEAQAVDIPAEIAASRFLGNGGYAVLPGLFSEADLAELLAEAMAAREAGDRYSLLEADALPERGGRPARAFRSGAGGACQWRLMSSPELLAKLSQIAGLPVRPLGGGSFTYYEQPGDFLGLHRDILSCDLAGITCLSEFGPEVGSGGLVVYPGHAGQPLAGVRSEPRDPGVAVAVRPGEMAVMLGGIVPHEVTAMAAGQERIVSVMCYRIDVNV